MVGRGADRAAGEQGDVVGRGGEATARGLRMRRRGIRTRTAAAAVGAAPSGGVIVAPLGGDLAAGLAAAAVGGGAAVAAGLGVGDLEPVGAGRRDGADAAGDHQLALAAGRGHHLDPALVDGHRRRLLVDGDGEHRALYERDQIGRADSEMRCLLLLDPEHRPPIVFDHLDDALRFPRLLEAKARAGGDDYIILAAHQHRPGAGAGLDDVAGFEHRPALHRREAAAVADLDLAGGFGDAPDRLAGEGGAGGCREGEEDKGAAQGHGAGHHFFASAGVTHAGSVAREGLRKAEPARLPRR